MNRVPARARHGTVDLAVGSTRRLAGPARLVGLGFRGWLAGLERADLTHLELVWSRFSGQMGPRRAQSALTALSDWVGAIRETTHRPIELKPLSCPRFCRDECVAVSLIAAAQHDTCPAMRACAFALIGHSNIDCVVSNAEVFAKSLSDAGLNVGDALAIAEAFDAPTSPDLAKARTVH